MDIKPRRPSPDRNRFVRPSSRGRHPLRGRPDTAISQTAQSATQKIQADNDIKSDDTDEKLIDLYSDFNEDIRLKSDKELAELKRLAQTDALRAYGFMRRTVAKFKLRSRRILRAVKLKRIKIAAVCLLLTVAGLGIYQFWPSSDDSSVLGLENIAMAFTPLLPGADQHAISARNYDKELDVFSFQHTIGEQNVTIAQQPLPETIASREGGAEQVAAGLSADGTYESLKSSKGTIYLSNSSNGGQAAVFIYADLLIFINSLEPFNSEQLVAYISEMQQ